MVIGEKLKVFAVKFDGDKTVFGRGENVSGRVEIQPESEITMKALNIQFLGKSRVRWSERQGQVTVVYSKTQTLFSQTRVVGKSTGSRGSVTTLSPTLHTFPFSFQLPTTVPGSYRDNIGFIRYVVKASVDNRRHKTKTYFEVPPLLDLNSRQNMLVPSAVTMDRTVCCWCCSSGPINVKFRTDRAGYVPGDTIIINGIVTNGSRSSISKISLKLVKKVSYFTNSKSKRSFSTIAKQTLVGCKAGRSVNLVNKRLVIPPTYPSGCRPCEIMDFEHSVRIRVRYGGLKFLVKAPVVIGTIPLNEPGAERDPPQSTSIASPTSIPFYATASTKVAPESGQKSNQEAGGNYYNWGENKAFTYN